MGGFRPTCSQGPPSAVAREMHDASGANNAADAQGVWEALTYSSVSSQPCGERRSPSPRGAHGPADGRRAPPTNPAHPRSPGETQETGSLVFPWSEGLVKNSVPGRKRGCKLIRRLDPLIVLFFDYLLNLVR